MTASILAVLRSLALGRIERLLSALMEQSAFELGARPAAEIARGIIDSVMAFTGGGEQKDDVTLVVVKKLLERG